jgi:hypothetical protein
MLRIILWIIIIYIFAKVLGVILQILRPLFSAPQQPHPTVGQKKEKTQFDNIQDAEFEDITDKK